VFIFVERRRCEKPRGNHFGINTQLWFDLIVRLVAYALVVFVIATVPGPTIEVEVEAQCKLWDIPRWWT
jgi:hypothetical protein